MATEDAGSERATGGITATGQQATSWSDPAKAMTAPGASAGLARELAEPGDAGGRDRELRRAQADRRRGARARVRLAGRHGPAVGTGPLR